MPTTEALATLAAIDDMQAAKKHIDEEFGRGYAAKNPSLVAAFMQAVRAANATERYVAALDELASAIRAAGESARAGGVAISDAISRATD